LDFTIQSLSKESSVTTIASAQLPELLRQKADQLRIHSIRATTKAGSGHPTSCCSAADIVATLFFSVMRFDPQNPRNPDNDRFVLSKGHAAPLLYAAWAEAGLFDPKQLLELRTLESDLEGHPTPRLSFVDMVSAVGLGMIIVVTRLGRRMRNAWQRRRRQSNVARPLLPVEILPDDVSAHNGQTAA
jgi:transketolase N-terminal domain/subunit